MRNKDSTVGSTNLYETKDYGKFKTIAGNRFEDKKHTATLVKKIKREGNLTPNFPILVNEKMEIIDGLHRLRALEQLDYPVFYEIKEGLNVSDVISLNTGHKNWTWQDYATSWAERGNKNYAQLLELNEQFHERFKTLLVYCAGTKRHDAGQLRAYQEGEFVIPDFNLTRKLLQQYQDLKDAANHDTREFAYAAYSIMRVPKYDHMRMIQKLSAYGERLRFCYSAYDYTSALDEIWRM